MNSDEMAAQILAALAALPPHEQEQAIHALISSALHDLPVEVIYSIRGDIQQQFPEPDIPIVASTLNLIEGHLALREMGVMS